MLLDEPFAGVDAPTREGLIEDFAENLSETRPTTVLVTHDRDEALRLGDEAALLIDGQLRQTGPPSEVFERPADRAVAEFVGMENLWHGRRSESGVYEAGGIRLASTAKTIAPGSPALLCVRPERIVLTQDGVGSVPSSGAGTENQLRAIVQTVRPRGPVVRANLTSGWLHLTVDTPVTLWDELRLSVGDAAVARFAPADVHVISDDGAD